MVGVASSGLHSNGFSLVRRVFADAGMPLTEELLTPTRIYVRALLDLVASGADVRGAAHITGGGLIENVPRMLPAGLGARMDAGAWLEPPIFDTVRRVGRVPEEDMRATFNLGLGLVLAIPRDEADEVAKRLGEAWVVGEVTARPGVELR